MNLPANGRVALAVVTLWTGCQLASAASPSSGYSSVIGTSPHVAPYTLNRIQVTRTYTPSNIGGAISPGTTTYPVGTNDFKVGWSYNWPDPVKGPNTNQFIVEIFGLTAPTTISPPVVYNPSINPTQYVFSGYANGGWTASGYGDGRDHTWAVTGIAGGTGDTYCCNPSGNRSVANLAFNSSPAIPPAIAGEIKLPILVSMDFGSDQGIATMEIDLIYDPGPTACPSSSYSVQLPSSFPGYNGGSFNVGVTAFPGCAWSANLESPYQGNGWLTIFPSGGVGSGSVTVSVGPNTIVNNIIRGGYFSIAGQLVGYTQPPSPGPNPGGTYTLNRLEVTRTYGAGVGGTGTYPIQSGMQTFPASAFPLAFQSGWDFFWAPTSTSPATNRNRFVSTLNFDSIDLAVTPGSSSQAYGAFLDMGGDWVASGYGVNRYHTLTISGSPFGGVNDSVGQTPTDNPDGNGPLSTSIGGATIPIPTPDGNGEVRLVFYATTDFESAGTVTLEVDLVYTLGSTSSGATVVSLTPAASTGSTQGFQFLFTGSGSYQTLTVLDVLINSYLDGRQACYMAYSVPNSTLYLVNDGGTALLPTGLPLNAYGNLTGSIGNSQCTISASGSYASGSGAYLTLALNITFSTSFGGSKAIYAAARDATTNTGWQTLGAHTVPAPVTYPNPESIYPTSGNTLTTSITFDYQDQSSATNLQTVWALINTAIDGRAACFVAYYRPGNYLYLYPDNGVGTQATSMVLTGSNSLSNSQCTVSALGSYVQTSGNTLALTLAITFKPAFAGFKGVWLAASTLSNAVSTWHAVGAWTVPSN